MSEFSGNHEPWPVPPGDRPKQMQRSAPRADTFMTSLDAAVVAFVQILCADNRRDQFAGQIRQCCRSDQNSSTPYA